MFQLIGTPKGIGKVMIQLKDTPSKVYTIGAELFLSKVPLEVLQNFVLIQLKRHLIVIVIVDANLLRIPLKVCPLIGS